MLCAHQDHVMAPDWLSFLTLRAPPPNTHGSSLSASDPTRVSFLTHPTPTAPPSRHPTQLGSLFSPCEEFPPWPPLPAEKLSDSSSTRRNRLQDGEPAPTNRCDGLQ